MPCCAVLCRCRAGGRELTQQRDKNRLIQDGASTPVAQDRSVSAVMIQRASVAAQTFHAPSSTSRPSLVLLSLIPHHTA